MSKELRELLDDKFQQHEHRSALAINELKAELTAVIHAQDKAAQERHGQTLGVLASHASRLDVHDLRLGKVEENTRELSADRKSSLDDTKRWLLGFGASVVMAILAALVSLALRGR